MNEVEMKKERIEKEIAEKAVEYGMTYEELRDVLLSFLCSSIIGGERHIPGVNIRIEVLEALRDKGLVISIYPRSEITGLYNFYITEPFFASLRDIAYFVIYSSI